MSVPKMHGICRERKGAPEGKKGHSVWFPKPLCISAVPVLSGQEAGVGTGAYSLGDDF